ncbi:unnamed protein product [Dovyalis caffra]|uniref:Uncharacterized protein n=1 Tax=Dovyalis caffra TaxID=77055 RepID=A0AAV1QWT3_9ROSI|nr:unnamed protein product [Dovyalis caffra]
MGKGRMGSTMLLHLVPMDLHRQLPISSLKGIKLERCKGELETRKLFSSLQIAGIPILMLGLVVEFLDLL